MKKFGLAIVLFMSANAFAGPSGMREYSTEELVATLLNSQELLQEKASQNISIPLSTINIERSGGAATIYLTYSNGGAPCSVRAVVSLKNVTPEGAAGINIRPVVSDVQGACAVNN